MAKCSETNCSSIPIRTVSMLRIGGDRFEAAATPLTALYSRVQIGGFVMVDGYYQHPKIKSAVDSFRFAAQIIDPISHIEEETRDAARPHLRAAWWQRTS